MSTVEVRCGENCGRWVARAEGVPGTFVASVRQRYFSGRMFEFVHHYDADDPESAVWGDCRKHGSQFVTVEEVNRSLGLGGGTLDGRAGS